MVVTVFRSRIRPDAAEEYGRWATRMADLARKMPGYLSVEFESEDAQRGWATHPAHLEAPRKGRNDFYLEFRVQVCIEQRTRTLRPST